MQRPSHVLAHVFCLPYHDIGHHIKNVQASLERGTHFDGRYGHESTYLSLLLSLAEDEVAELM